ncbi:MAG TPA: hypothetical protein VGQ74_06810 [Methylomirabilota bacterium]|jgi:hypothetical protein|nr:hypothetical protein [Methylomirabilota bacterium]
MLVTTHAGRASRFLAVTPATRRGEVAPIFTPSEAFNLVALTLGLGLAFFGEVEQMDRSAKFFPLQHCVDAIQDDKVAQAQLNQPQAATASASPAKSSSIPRED